MNFADAVRSVLTKYATFDGRARRSEYWWFYLFSAIVGLVAEVLDKAIGKPVLAVIIGLALLVPSLAVGCRRLHDTGRSGWWQLIAFIPIVGAILLIVWFCFDSNRGTNGYGQSPKYPDGGGPAGGGGWQGGGQQYPGPQYPPPGQAFGQSQYPPPGQNPGQQYGPPPGQQYGPPDQDPGQNPGQQYGPPSGQ